MSYWLKILTPYDGSDYATKAVTESIRLAERFNSKVTVLNVCWDKSDDESRILLKGMEEPLRKSGVRYELRSARAKYPAEKILDIIDKERFDCVVLGAKGIGGAVGLILGSVATKVASESKCTVILSR